MAVPLALLFGYLSGSIPVGLFVGKFYGVDLRAKGSGRIGATNALRALGPRVAVWVLVGDTLKAVVPVALSRLLLNDPVADVAAAIAAVVGHNWPVFSQFKGGRGVSSAFGTGLVMAPLAAIIGCAVFVVLSLTTRYVSLGSVIGMIVSGALFVWLAASGGAPPAYGVYGVLGAGLVVVRHWDNIQRLLAGTERRIGKAE